jgi:glucose/arabinose dehydrogenase
MTNLFFKPALILSLLIYCSGTTDKKLPPSELKLPQGFQAETVVESLGSNRHLTVNSNGDIYVRVDKLINGKGIIVLRKQNGKYEAVKSFGDFIGTGIVIKSGYLYASSNSEVFRYKMVNNEVADADHPEKIVTGLRMERQHESKSIALDNAGNLYVTIGAPSNACQVMDRTAGSPGQDPCPILQNAGGIWQFKANKLNQSYAQSVRYATGIRNIVGIDWNNRENQLYAVQHGRDQLSQFWPDKYNDQQSAELPAEEFFLVKKGSDFGWPYCYYDQMQKKKVQSPEYGGDGKTVGRCADKTQPIMGFPGHWAPNDLLFYTGTMFPEKYRNGAFIAFHGSWNRGSKQEGFHVIFVPFKNGKPSGNYEIFADGFAGAATIAGPNQAKYRPCGLAQGPDGALYISESQKGKIWKVVYRK